MSSSEALTRIAPDDKGRLIVVSAPAGTGKTTLVRMLVDEFPNVQESVSVTTRAARPNEKEGLDYHFVSQEEFERQIDQDQFLESVQFLGHYYGTSAVAIEQQQRTNHVVLTIDTQGALKLKDKVTATYVFIRPPSEKELRRRLVERKTESDDVIERRLAWSKKELALAIHYDYIIVNDNLNTAYEILRSILIAEAHHNIGGSGSESVEKEYSNKNKELPDG
ncbi:Guanylate kinase [Chlamydiales bacterium SCGC AG-110-P3]|nr:Guanylate kinase [Chlamydiales bacterium SCGC AG-110-P3]